MPSQTEYKVHLQSNREIYTKIQILNSSNVILQELEGLATDGNIDIDSQSPIRRTCSITFALKPELIPSSLSPLWINKRFRLWTGIKDISTGEIVYFNKGIYLINDPSTDIQINDKSISIKGLDLMARITGDISGQLLLNTVIQAGVKIDLAIKTTMQTLALETNLIIDISPYTVPYKIEKDLGDTIWSAIEECTGLYMNWQSYYDENGFFNFNKKKNLINDPIIWDFNENNLNVSISNQFKYSNVKNYIKVIGKLKDDGTQATYTIEVRDATYPNSPFTIEKLNETNPRTLIIPTDTYYTQDQCKERAEYEVNLHNNMAEEISVSCLPIYLLDVNNLIYVKDLDAGVDGKYSIDKISLPLGINELMNLVCHKVY